MKDPQFQDIGACVFDAYSTLFDVGAATKRFQDALGEKLDALVELWQRKQLEYAWLRSLMSQNEDYWQITADSLDYAMGTLGIEDTNLRARLMQLYHELDPYPEVVATLERIKAKGMKVAILSNGSLMMLTAAAKRAGLLRIVNPILSAESAGVFKPHPEAYRLAATALKLEPRRICFLSADSWDVAGAATFGFRVGWVNRRGQPSDMLPGDPEAVIETLDELPALLGV